MKTSFRFTCPSNKQLQNVVGGVLWSSFDPKVWCIFLLKHCNLSIRHFNQASCQSSKLFNWKRSNVVFYIVILVGQPQRQKMTILISSIKHLFYTFIKFVKSGRTNIKALYVLQQDVRAYTGKFIYGLRLQVGAWDTNIFFTAMVSFECSSSYIQLSLTWTLQWSL